MSPKKTIEPEILDGVSGEPAGGSIPASEELEAALREATAALEAGQAGGRGGDASPDKLILEALSGELQSIKKEYEGKVSEFEELREERDVAVAELADQKDQHLRLQAEFDNFRRRSLKERQEAFQYGNQDIVKDLLTTVDNLERAAAHARRAERGDPDALLEGVDLVSRELLGVFGKYGVTVIEALNRPFDPSVHEAMGQIEDASVPPNTVVQVLQTGYQLRDRMLRPAMVMVSKPAAGGQVSAKAAKPGAGSTEESQSE